MIIKCTENDKNMRLDLYLQEKIDGISRTAIQKMILDGNIIVNGEKVKKNHVISVSEEITVTMPEISDVDILPEEIPLNIVFEDEYMVVINKPKGMVVHPAPGHSSGTLVNALMHHCKDSLSGINGEARPGIVHRIDKDTSGLLVVAKNDFAHLSLSEQIKKHSAQRLYKAIVFGSIKDDIGTIDKPIGRHKTDRKRMTVTEHNSRYAKTHFEVIERYDNGLTYVKFKLETGRTHQIRVHLQYIGYPIFNDPTYSVCAATPFGQFLHSVSLEFIHPITKEKMHFDAPLPLEFQTKINLLDEEIENSKK